MTDERDLRLPENGTENEEENLREHRSERVVARTAPGRFPSVPQGRMPATPGSRFTQTGMPAVPRASVPAAPPVPPSASNMPAVPHSGLPSTGNMPNVAAGRGRGGRPGIVTPRVPSRPVIHAQDQSGRRPMPEPQTMTYGQETAESESQAPQDVLQNVPVDDAMAALDDVFGMGAPQPEAPSATFAAAEPSSDISGIRSGADFAPLPQAESETAADMPDGGAAQSDVAIARADLAGEAAGADAEHAQLPEDSGISNDSGVLTSDIAQSQDAAAAGEEIASSQEIAVSADADADAVVSSDEEISNRGDEVSERSDVSAAAQDEDDAAGTDDAAAEENSAAENCAEEYAKEDENIEDESSELLMTEVPERAADAVAEVCAADENDDEDEDASPQSAADSGPAFEIKPIPPELRQEQSLRDNAAYRKESRSLLRAQSWNDLVQLMENALLYAVWADMPEVRSSILKELAGIYLDKLNNAEKAKATYRQLLRESPSNESALSYMEDEYRKTGDCKAIRDMYRRVVDVTWDSEERILYTRKASEIAERELSKPALAIADWEHLWEIGEHGEEVQNALMAVYRSHENWEKLASFIKERCIDWKTTQELGLREVVEIYISGMGNAERASETLSKLLSKRPDDPLLLLQDVNVCRISGDIDKLAQISRAKCADPRVETDLRRAAADVLWDKGERELAVQAYDTILEDLPNDRDALHIKEVYFSEGGHYEQLCQFYEQRAGAALEQNRAEEAVGLYEKAADVAEKQLFDNERAISVLNRIIELDPNDAATYRRIIALYEALGDDLGQANAMESLLAITSRPSVRTELLSKLGRFYLDKLSNFEKAESCWKKVQAIDPRNPEVSEELSRVYAKQGDFESLDKSLTQQIRIADDASILHLAEKKAQYLTDNGLATAHAAASWEIVLDCDPDNANACERLGEVLEKLSRNEEMIGIWTQELATVRDLDERISLGLRIADACVDNAPHAQAVAAYLRVLRWNPRQESALIALESICAKEENGIVRAALETAAAAAETNEERCALLKRTLRFIAPEHVGERINVMQRILLLGDLSIESDFASLCRSSQKSEFLCMTWIRRAGETDDAELRDKLLFDAARLCAEDLQAPDRAFTLLCSVAIQADKAKRLAEELEQLAPQTNRWEEVVAVLNCLASKQFDDETRKAALLKSIDILLGKLDAPDRAVSACNRLLAMNPDDSEILGKIEKLAGEHHLQAQLLTVYGELWDKSQSAAVRAEISEKRLAVYRALDEQDLALTELFVAYRAMPSASVEAAIEAECGDAHKAAVCLPLLESEKSASDPMDLQGLARIAKHYAEDAENIDGAFDLRCAILTQLPSDDETFGALVAVATDPKRQGRFAQAARLAASRAKKSGDCETSLRLYRALAQFYKKELGDLERSIDVECAILRIDPDCVESLEALISWHESRQEWTQLRSELKQRLHAGAPNEEKVAIWLRIVAISRDCLNDIEGTFDGYAEILQIDETNAEAHQGIEQMTGENIGPDVELRRLRLELKLADEAKRPQIMLSIAKLQNDVLSLPDAACETLEALFRLTGPLGPGYEPLCKSCEKSKLWSNLVQIKIEHAHAQIENDDEDAAVITLQDALQIADKHLKNDPIGAQVIAELQKLDPENEDIIERYCSSLRKTENWTQYAETIQSLSENCAGGSASRKSYLFELARIKAVALGDIDGALTMYREINRSGGVERNAYFGIATLALKKGDIDLYLNALDQVLRLLDPVWGAIFYCHMAEVCDEKDRPNQVAVYYRSARALDPDNAVASDSLRSIGRRLKNWRATSALLPAENERELSWPERSKLLAARAKTAENTDEARIWLWKAIAVDHDNADAWNDLAHLEHRAGNPKARYEACFGAYGTIERTTLPGLKDAVANAQSIYEVSQAASDCGNDAKSEALLRRAYALAPDCAPIAMAIGDIEQDSGNIDKAYGIYDAILENPSIQLDDKTKSELYFKRGLIANILQNYPQALDDLRTTVKMSPLHYEALMAIAKTYADLKQPLLAIAALQRGLIVTDNKTKRRGNIYYDMGKIWGDDFKDHAEAGIYYEGALNNGASNVDLIERSLEIYKRAGRYREALDLADTLIKTTSNSAILASLWCTKGELSEKISPEQATEAYDMALSYVPGIARAFDGLERMLIARGEYAQLADLLNGRLEGEHTKAEECAILLKLADLYAKQLGEQEKAADILCRLLDAMPSADVVSRLLAMPQNDEEKKRALYEKAIVYCDGSYPYALELAQQHLKNGRDLQAWAIMSPLRALLQLDAQTKETLNDLKNKFEKADAVSFDSIAKALPVLSDEQFAILDALKTLSEHMQFGPSSIDQIAAGASEVSENTPNGKIFAQLRAGMGLDNAVLCRASELPEAIAVVAANPPVICIRTEIFQKAAGNELQFWLAKAVAMAHPDMRFLASAPAAVRNLLPKALLAAAGLGSVSGDAADLAQKIKTTVSADVLKDIRSQLTLYPDDRLIACAETFAQDMLDSTDLIGAFIVADMRTVWRAESRIDENIAEQRNVKTVDDISKAIDASKILRKILAYYVSSTFTEQLNA